jgi:hypothetical protein
MNLPGVSDRLIDVTKMLYDNNSQENMQLLRCHFFFQQIYVAWNL